VDGYTVGEVARLARISVRTLHHYDGIGLLTPSARSAGGYRLYSECDLDRLRRVLFYRELEFGLDQIAEILADAAARTDDHLRPVPTAVGDWLPPPAVSRDITRNGRVGASFVMICRAVSSEKAGVRRV